jgi:hypothetical protein
MPLDIKGILVNRLLVGEVMHLLKDHHSQHRIKFLGRTAQANW